MAKKVLTAEQEAKRDERHARFSELTSRIGAMSEDERAQLADRMAGAVTVEGRGLSVGNACLIACQFPTATVVGGFQQWRKAGRFVRKGEHGLMIWAPTKGAAEVADPAASTGGEVGEVSENGRRHFIMVTVFDVSQTDVAEGGA